MKDLDVKVRHPESFAFSAALPDHVEGAADGTPGRHRTAGAGDGRKLAGYAAVLQFAVCRPRRLHRNHSRRARSPDRWRAIPLDPLALLQHMPHLVLGRRSAGTLRLAEDARGLAFEIDLPDTTAARDLAVSVARGDIKGASFAFTVPPGGDSWATHGDTVMRELRE